MKVFFRSAYVTERNYVRTQPEWAAFWFVKAIKGKAFNSPKAVKCPEGILSWSNRDTAFIWFGNWAAEVVSEIYPSGETLNIIPVPSKAALIENHKQPPQGTSSDQLAAHLAHALGDRAVLTKVLWWQKQLQRAHDGGTRDPQKLHDKLEVKGEWCPVGPIILVDDMFTFGGHLEASVAHIARAAGLESTESITAICAGKTANGGEFSNPFEVSPIDLPEWTPADCFSFNEVAEMNAEARWQAVLEHLRVTDASIAAICDLGKVRQFSDCVVEVAFDAAYADFFGLNDQTHSNTVTKAITTLFGRYWEFKIIDLNK